MRIIIESIPHSKQRYDTCGDYYERECSLHIKVSELADKREVQLIAIHELIEWALCNAKGITNEEIDKFDLGFSDLVYDEPARGTLPAEPGDDTRAPYYTQHQTATGIEKILAAQMGVDWLEYERHIAELKR